MSIRPDGRPPFRAEHVGSLLRPAALRQAFRRHAGQEIDDGEFARILDQCIADAVRMQEEIGLAVVTDGEFRRGSYWARFVERTSGLEIRPASFAFHDDHGHEMSFTAPYATARMRRTQPLALDEFEFLRDAAKVTPKITLPSPSTMHFLRCADFADRHVYPDAESFFDDLVAVFAQEIADLVAAGCRYLQIDEIAIALLCDPAIRDKVAATGSDPDQLVDLYVDAINRAVAACPPRRRGRRPHVPRQPQGPLSRRRQLRVGRRALLRRHSRQSLPARIRHAAGGRFRAAALRAEGQGASCSVSSAARPPSSSVRTACIAAWRTQAEIYRPRPAGDQPAMRLCQHRRGQSAERGGSSAPSCAWSSRWRRRSGR